MALDREAMKLYQRERRRKLKAGTLRPHEDGTNAWLASFVIGEARWFATTLEHYARDQRALNAPISRRPELLKSWRFATHLFTAVSASKAGRFGLQSTEGGKTMTTKVIFRRYRNGDIIALFPELPGNDNPSTCNSYMHVGQHGAADPHIVGHGTELATPEQYAPLLAELVRQGYDDLKVYKRVSHSAYRTRRDQLRGTA